MAESVESVNPEGGTGDAAPKRSRARKAGSANVLPWPGVSVVIPIFNEEANIKELHRRLAATLDCLERPSEVWFVDDGSTDGSLALLRELTEIDPRVQVIQLTRNAGQHAAVMAGFASCRGSVVVTLDGDLQNPPEEIPTLLAKIDEGCEVVGGWRETRHDPLVRRVASHLVNRATSAAVGVRMRDYGCMLRAYRREIVEEMLACDERSLFIPALANTLARRTAEVQVGHADRLEGTSRYTPLKLMRLAFDLMTGVSLLPIQLVSVFGILVALGGLGFGVFLFVRRLIVGPESEGVFTLFAILFVFLGVLILGVGLIGEYVGRIYLEVRHRPLYRVRAVHRPKDQARREA
jgi:undecaprenyl-phosphate 4-deoxy-4-formamido-L-arabinose transferase